MSSPPLRFEASRWETLLTTIGGVIVAMIGVPLIGYATGKMTTIPWMVFAGGITALFGVVMIVRQMRHGGLEWIELDDNLLAVGIRHETRRFRWDEITKVVLNTDPEHLWYVYTNEPKPVLQFHPGGLKFQDQKAIRAFVKTRMNHVFESSQAQVFSN